MHSISKHEWRRSRGIYWSAGNSYKLYMSRLCFRRNCFLTSFINFFDEYRMNSSGNWGFLIFLFFISTSCTNSSRVKQSSPRCFLSLSSSTTRSLRHSKNLSFFSCYFATYSSSIDLVRVGLFPRGPSNNLQRILLVKKRS